MKREISYLECLDIVYVKTSGIYKLNEEAGTLERALNEMKKRQCRKALFDHRETTVVLDTLTAFGRSKNYDDIGFERSVKIASVVNDICENLKFYELSNTNRGWQVKIFADYDAAIAWLT